MAQPFFAYMIECADRSYYVGHTDDLGRRISEHQAGGMCAYTQIRRPVRLIWSEEFATREEALAAELRIKKWSRAKKEALARHDFVAVSAAAKKTHWETYRRRRQR